MKSRYLNYEIYIFNPKQDIYSRYWPADLWPWYLQRPSHVTTSGGGRREAPRALCADVWLQHLSWSEHGNCAWHGRLKPYECENCQLPWSSDYLVVMFSTIRRFPLVFSFSRCKVQSAECTVSHWSSEKEPRQWDQRRNNATNQWRVLLQDYVTV